jgi:hypothetical protein
MRGLAAAFAIGATACIAAGETRGPGSGSVLTRYDLASPPQDRWELPKDLAELSGLALAAGGRVLAHGDERAIIFELDPAAHRVVKRFEFGRPAAREDFEGIAVADDRVFLVTSDGVLYEGPEGGDGEAVEFVTHVTGAGRSCEVEGLAYEPESRSLLLACKTPRVAALEGRLTVLRWSLDRAALDSQPRFSVPLERAFGVNLHPSEIMRDPATGHYLVLAAREHVLAELSSTGEVVATVGLPRSLHPQAESLALLPDGSLLIGNERKSKGARGTLSIYRRR